MAHRPSFDERRAWLLDALDKTMDAFEGVTFEAFEDDWKLQRMLHGCLAAIGQDLHVASGLADPNLARHYRKVRNALGHEYMRTPASELWGALQGLPELRESVEQHRTPPQRQRPRNGSGHAR